MYDAGAKGKFGHILEHFQDLQARGPPQGYFLEPTKSILVVATRNVARAEEFFRGIGMKIVTGSWYLGVFVGDRAAKDSCLTEKIQGWAESLKTLLGVAHRHLQSTYSGLKKSLQQDWEFLQRVTSGIRDAFGLVEKALQETFIPALFQGLGEETPGRGVTNLPVKKARLVLAITQTVRLSETSRIWHTPIYIITIN